MTPVRLLQGFIHYSYIVVAVVVYSFKSIKMLLVLILS
jgi:hypothetical protein